MNRFSKSILSAFAALALTVSLAHSAAPDFVKSGSTYTLVPAQGKPTVVDALEDKGNGWFKVRVTGSSAELIVNLSLCTAIIEGQGIALADAANADFVKVSITNNVRQLSAAADQYFLENAIDRVIARELIGPDRYIKELVSYDGEDYSAILIRSGQTMKVRTKSGIEVEWRQ